MSYLEERRKHIEAGRPLKPKKVYTISKKSAKQIQKEKEQETVIVKPKKAGWFDANGAISKEAMDEIANGTGMYFPTAKDFALQPKPKGNAELQRWFEDRRAEMVGYCDNCGGKTCKDDDKYYKFSIAHLLPKSHVKSVATHEKNWLELCHFGNGCHNSLDTHMLDLTEMSCWDKIIERFVAMYPSVSKEERRRIPQILLQYLDVEK